MNAPSRKRPVRNIVLAVILVGVTIVLMFTRLGSWLGDDPQPTPANEPSAASEPPVDPPPPLAPNSEEPKPETATITFPEFSEQYAALRENFRARDSLTVLVVDKHVQWEGYVRNVTKHATAFYVTVWASQSFGGPSASITFDHSMEDELYALQQSDYVRFEGVVTRAAGSVGIEGLEIDVIEQAGP